MVFRLTKLKILLMVDLLILIFVIPGYFFAYSQIPTPAEFELLQKEPSSFICSAIKHGTKIYDKETS